MKRQDADALRMRKEKARIVRFLAAGAAEGEAAVKEGFVLISAAERGTISVDAVALSSLLRNGIVQRDKTRLSLSSDGIALAKRDRAGEEAFRAQHQELGSIRVSMENGEHLVLANLGESPLAQLARRRARNGEPFLLESEFRAGERLRADYTRGQVMPRLGANWSAAVANSRRGGSENGIAELTDAALAARERVDRALRAVGPELAGVLVDICCFLKGVEQVETERGWPVRSAKVVLKTALSALSRHYEPQRRERRGAILHWGTNDYRPRM